MMIGQNNQGLFAGLFFMASIFLPDIRLEEGVPAIQCNDILLPILVYYCWKGFKEIKFPLYYFFLLFFSIYILFTIFLNQRWNSLNDYFEIYKVLKFGIVVAFYSLTLFTSWKKIIIISGIILGIINIIHFFEFKAWNDLLYTYYNGGLNLVYFGKNSLMELSSKRMVGMMGNPNTNAILFSGFSFYTLPSVFNKKNFLLFLFFLTLALMCQSRTTLISICLVLSIFFIFKFHNWNKKQILYFILGLITSYITSLMLCSRFFTFPIYVNSIINGAVLETNSVLGRLESWKFLGEMILQKPIIGYGPNKDFFYSRNLYSENEYILYTWRYGIIGLIIYFGIYLIPLKIIYFDNKDKYLAKTLVLISCLILTSSLTNNPLTARNIAVLFAVIIGTSLGQIKKQKINE